MSENKDLEIDLRKKRILKAIVDEYINTALPVSSSEILEKYNMDVSSATIRNDMALLESLGYIRKPHTSAGRIPSELGYRYYVEELIDNRNILSNDDLRIIKLNLENEVNKLEDLSKIVGNTISELTHYLTVSVGRTAADDTIVDIKFIKLTDNTIMVLLITYLGVIKQSIIEFEEDIDFELLEKIEIIFKRKLYGKKLSDIDSKKIIKYISQEAEYGIMLAKKIIFEIEKSLFEDSEIYFSGSSKSFRLPEFREIEIQKAFFDILDDKDLLREVLDLEIEKKHSNISIYIGDENSGKDIFKNFSIIKLEQNTSDGCLGTVAILGPKRMDYTRVIQIAQAMSDEIERKYGKRKKRFALVKIEDEEDDEDD